MLSGGRYELGVGVGWDAQEFAVAGVKLSERGGRTDEILDIFAKLWTGDEVTHHGRYYDFEGVAIDPPLPTMPLLWVAGGSKIKTGSVARPGNDRADACSNASAAAPTAGSPAPPGSNESVIADWGQITRRLDEIGRPRGSVTFAHVNMTHVVPTDDEAAALKIQRPLIERVMGTHRSFEHLRTCYMLGTPAQIRNRVAELAEAGLEYLMLSPLGYDSTSSICGRRRSSGISATGEGGEKSDGLLRSLP